MPPEASIALKPMQQSSPYSPLKVFHHKKHIDALRDGQPIAPVHVQIIPTNVCNQCCSFCSYRAKGYSSNETFQTLDSIPREKLLEIVADCESMGVKAIEVTGGGEPLCHPNIVEMCQAILDAEIDLGMVSNGSRWTPELAHVMRGAKWIRYSIDAGCAATYSTIRKVPATTYDKVRDAVRLQRSKRGNGADPIIGVGFVVTRDNWQEVVDAAARAKADGADNIRISAVFQNEEARYFDAFGVEAAALCREAESLNDGSFRVFNLFTDRVHDLIEGKPDYSYCGFQHFCTYIGADQQVYRCCVVAYNHIGLLGSIANQRFSELWQSPQVAGLLNNFDARQCPRCMFNNKNRTIQYAVDSAPRHVNFM